MNLTNLGLGGHLAYDLEAAWALMELAGYDMKPFRAYYGETSSEPAKTNGIALAPSSIILAIAALSTIRFGRKLRREDRKQ
jgi:hypothetical protein